MKSTLYPLHLKKIGAIALAWTLISVIQVCYDYLVVLNYIEYAPAYRFWSILLVKSVTAFIAGSIAGYLIVRLDAQARTMPFWKMIVKLVFIYTIYGILLMSLGSLAYQTIVQQRPVFSQEVLSQVKLFMVGPDFIKTFLTWGGVMVGTIVTLAVNDKYGQGNFRDFLLGRYFQPREEERIFMFLDIRGSTTIAEQLGAKKYFHFLKTFIKDATLPILQTKGEIYQYVGDEIIVSWRMEKGIQDANCLQCFYLIQEAIFENERYYMDQYNNLPSFKAGLHYGQVMVGEMGMVKKEITFSGDVLNTASRIQMACNQYQVDILLSNSLISLLPLPPEMKSQNIGDIELRGKQETVRLSTISLNY